MSKGILSALFAVFMLFGLAACEDDGSMERAGEEIDDAARDLREGADDAADDLEDEFN
mgnify:CR=1 FL=1